MKKDVLIHVSGIHMTEDEDRIEVEVAGQYYFRNGSHYVRYEERMDENEQPTINYIKISPNTVEVRKQGTVNANMVFERGKKNVVLYSTPMGTLHMDIAATNIVFEEDEDELMLKLDYSLDVNEMHVSDCYLTLHVQSKESFTL